MNQSELEAKSCSRWKARENGRQPITVDVGLIEIDSENKNKKQQENNAVGLQTTKTLTNTECFTSFV